MRKLTITLLAAILIFPLTVPAIEAESAHRATAPDAPLPLADSALHDHVGLAVPRALSVGREAGTTASNTVFLPQVSRSARTFPPCPADSPFGVALVRLHEVQPDSELLRALDASGACWVSVGFDWSQIQPGPPVDGQPPDYDWSWFDDRLTLVAGTGVRMLAAVDHPPDWARGEPYPDLRCTNIRPDRLDEFAQFLTDLVNRYKEPPWNIHHWTLRNEPDGTTPDRAEVGQGCGGTLPSLYVQMLEIAYPAIKSADPEATVLMGGLAYDWFLEYEGPFYRYFPDDVMANGGGEHMDALNFHYFHDFYREWERWVPHGNPPTCGDVEDGQGLPYEAWGIDLIAKTNHLRNRMSVCHNVDLPVWVTELAEWGHAGDEVAIAQQARYVIQGYARGLAADVEKIFWFSLAESLIDEYNFGLLAVDYTPKPSFYAYQTLVAELSGWAYSRTLPAPDVEGYVFVDGEGHEKTAVWANGQPNQNVPLTFSATSRLRIVNRNSYVTYVDDGGPGDVDGHVNGSITIELPPVPVDPDPDNPPRLSAEPWIISH